MIEAANGKSMSAMKIFSITLGYFKDHALQELRDATGTKIAQVHLKNRIKLDRYYCKTFVHP